MRRAAAVLLTNEALAWGGFSMLIPLLSVHLTRDAGYSGAAAGAILAVRQLTQQGLMLFGGALADRIGYRPAIATGMLVRALGFFAFALGDQIGLVLAAAIVAGLGGALFEATGKAALAEVAPNDAARPRLFALSATLGSIGGAVGPAVGAALLPFSFGAVCIAAGLFFFVAFAASTLLLPPLGRGHHDAPSLTQTLRGVARDRRFLTFTALLAGFWFLHNQVYISVPLWAARLTGQPGSASALYATYAIAGIGLQFPLVRLATSRLPPGVVAGVGMAVMGLGLALFGLAGAVVPPEPALLIALCGSMVVFAAGRALVEPTKDVLTAAMAPRGQVAAYFGVAFLALAVGGSAGNYAGGWLYDWAGASGAYATPWILFTIVGAAMGAGLARFAGRQPQHGR